jgi:hypothetical protein
MALISDLHLATTMTLSLEAPIEDLKLSTRVRNVLRRSGLDTLGSLLEPNGKPAIRGFGLEARAELARALAASGFALPANLSSSEFNEVAESVSTLRGQIEASFQKWSAQIQHLELHIRRLGASERGRPAVAERSGRQHVSVALTGALADECKTRLTSICTASGCLLATRRLLPEQRELVSVIEEECIRLSGLLDCLLWMLPAPEHRPCRTGEANAVQ